MPFGSGDSDGDILIMSFDWISKWRICCYFLKKILHHFNLTIFTKISKTLTDGISSWIGTWLLIWKDIYLCEGIGESLLRMDYLRVQATCTEFMTQTRWVENIPFLLWQIPTQKTTLNFNTNIILCNEAIWCDEDGLKWFCQKKITGTKWKNFWNWYYLIGSVTVPQAAF